MLLMHMMVGFCDLEDTSDFTVLQGRIMRSSDAVTEMSFNRFSVFRRFPIDVEQSLMTSFTPTLR